MTKAKDFKFCTLIVPWHDKLTLLSNERVHGHVTMIDDAYHHRYEWRL